MPDPKKLDVAEFKDKPELSEEDISRIADAGIAEAEGEPAAEDSGDQDADKGKEQVEDKGGEGDPEKGKKKDEPADDKGKSVEGEKKDEKADEETDEQKAARIESERQNEIALYAEEHKMSVEDATKDFESAEKVIEEQGGDVKKLARKAVHAQRMFSRMQTEAKKAQEERTLKAAEAQYTVENIIESINNGEVENKGKKISRDEVIAAYRQRNPDLGDDVDDEVIVKLAAKDMRQNVLRYFEEQQKRSKDLAQEKRDKLLKELPAHQKQFEAEIKSVLDKTFDELIMREDFSLEDTVRWARGGFYTPARVKELEQAAYKRGLEEAKILGEKGGSRPAGGGSAAKGSSYTYKLNKQQMSEAEEMFASAGDGMKKEEMYQQFYDLYVKEDKK